MSVGLIFNIAIFALTIFLIVYFVFSKDGFIDLIKSGLEISIWWILAAVILHLLNITIDASIIYLFVRENTPNLKVRTAIKASMVGQFYCAITPSATGGQPMQILIMSRSGIKASVATSALIQKFLVWQFTLAIYCIILTKDWLAEEESLQFGCSYVDTFRNRLCRTDDNARNTSPCIICKELHKKSFRRFSEITRQAAYPQKH